MMKYIFEYIFCNRYIIDILINITDFLFISTFIINYYNLEMSVCMCMWYLHTC